MTGDFCAVCDPPDDWKAVCSRWQDDEIEIWFRAYTTTHRTTQHEIDLYEQGIGYECFVEVSDSACWKDIGLAHFFAENDKEAEHLLQVAADAQYR